MEEELEVYRENLQKAFDEGNIETIMKIVKELRVLNAEIPFSVEVQERRP